MTEIALKLQNVCKRFPYFALKNINLELSTGQIMGFIGANGAGKTTSIRLLMGLMQADSGDVEVLNYSMPKYQTIAKQNIGFGSEDMKLYGGMNLGWHINFIKSIYSGWDDNYAQELLKRFDLNLTQKTKGFSKGQHVKAQLLLVLARKPKLLILDEPTTGLDPVARQEVLQELALILRDEDRTVLFSSHNTADVEKISDQITFIDRGAIVDSQDKESYLERWKRIRVDLPGDSVLPEIKGVVQVDQNGRLASVVTNNFSESIINALKNTSANINEVENLSLEEIFLASVNYNRKVQA